MITVIRAKRAILDGAERAVTVVVDDERIAGVLPPDAAVVADREVVLAADEVLLPGLVDTTCTSTSQAALSGRDSPRRPERPLRAV